MFYKWLYLVLQVVFWVHISKANTPTITVKETFAYSNGNLPYGCTVKYLDGNCVLNCVNADIKEVLPALHKIDENITHIDVSECMPIYGILDYISLDEGTFSNMTFLKSVRIVQCEIALILVDTFTGLNLTAIDLSNNHLIIINSYNFKGLKNLQYLNLAQQMSLRVIQVDAFNTTCNIVWMYLNDNKDIVVFPNATRLFKCLTKLQVLQLSHVGMPRLAKNNATLSLFFEGQAESLLELDLSRNRMTNYYLPLLRHLKRLQKLNLSINSLGYIEAGSLPRCQNTSIQLNQNSILFISADSFNRLERVRVDLSDNPIICDCNIVAFADLLRAPNGTVKFLQANELRCGGPKDMYGKKVIDFNPSWWSCSPFFPLVALVFVIALLIVVLSVVLVVYCNWVNIKHWRLERKQLTIKRVEDDDDDDASETDPLYQPIAKRNSLRQGKTGAYVTYNYKDKVAVNWANKYLDENLQFHAMKITLQWSAGPEVIPLWKQVKDFSPQVDAFLVLVTDEFLDNHWPGIAEKSGIENIMKLVFVLFGMKKNDLPKELKRIGCPCLEWPETATKFSQLRRVRDQFWKELRIHLKTVSK